MGTSGGLGNRSDIAQARKKVNQRWRNRQDSEHGGKFHKEAFLLHFDDENRRAASSKFFRPKIEINLFKTLFVLIRSTVLLRTIAVPSSMYSHMLRHR